MMRHAPATGVSLLVGDTEMPTVMPFGKFKDERLDNLPEQYLEWLLTLPDLQPSLRVAVDRQLNLQERDDWLESAARACPRIIWEWTQRMEAMCANDQRALSVVELGRAVLERLCAEATGVEIGNTPADLEHTT